MNIRRDILKEAIKPYAHKIAQLTQNNNQVIDFKPTSNRCRLIEIKTNNALYKIPVYDILNKQPENIKQYLTQ